MKIALQLVVFAICACLNLTGCCEPLVKTVNPAGYISRDYNLVKGLPIQINEFGSPDLFLIYDSLKMDTMLGNYFDTFSNMRKRLKAIDFKKYSMVVGHLNYFGQIKEYSCFVNHFTKELVMAVSSVEECRESYHGNSQLVSFLIPHLSRDYKIKQE